MAGEKEDETAQRVDLVLGRREASVDRLGELLELDARVCLPQAVVEHRQHRSLCVVMLVLDVADDLLDDILDRNQAFGSTELINNDREMNSLGSHSGEELN